ncbi:TonB-dependent receptor [Sphingomonas hylomeconis]|uniref:Carboxypeptidase regulatory-like domain-containing protein n=1 Tax=Sphingomonas hylomeconis TaxID=1395958 RepID=A0ABV7SW22_9SPHN|nr:carboxypeptidase regulatory-like domain-containing protein [Sphingomonas hylomeconis]
MIRNFKLALAGATMLASGAIAIAPAAAQTTTASARGQVRDASGAGVGGVTVSAVNAGTNQTLRTETDATGSFTLNGLRPAQYTVTATAADGRTVNQKVIVAIGQALTLNLVLGESEAAASSEPDVDTGDDIVVTANRLIETKTSEIATNVSQQQLRTLPQTDRNFLSFAALAPGVRYNDSETDKGIQSGASTASQVNVFIDGVSLKNKLREGGIAGQQNSRGNPFGQLAVQEFRVLTQNYKAEYEQAGSAIITAVTKSGTNQFHGEVFGQYTDRGLSEKSFLDRSNNRAKPAFERKQYGIALGGPIIKDKLFFFATYEGNDQDRAFVVDSTGSVDNIAAFERASGRRLADFEGNFVSPFRGDFYFGKLTFTPDERQTFDLSYSRREETDIQGFGGNVSYEFAENKINVVDTYLAKWTYRGDNFVNEVNLNYLNYLNNPTSLNPDSPTYNYDTVILFGGREATRREQQQSYTLRDDFSYTGFDGHSIKVGARVEITDIEFGNLAYVQPSFVFRIDTVENPNTNLANDTDFSFPAEARLGLGNGTVRGSNTQLGFYVQDDWDVTDKLQLNLGLRWDYETNGNNNEFRTGDTAAAALRALPKTAYFDPEDYISTGKNRKPFAGAFAPRVGFSFDVNDDEQTVIFGGFGRYYDRNNFNNTIDEQSRTINPIGVFRFSRDGQPRNGLATTVWNPSYLTREGLLALRASSTSGLPELFAVKNNTKPPVNDQVSLGVRQQVGPVQVSVTGSYQRGRNGYTNLFATRQNGGEGPCCNTAPLAPFGYANALIGYDGLDTRYKALFVTVDKPYNQSSGWGVNLAYTLSKGEQNGGDLFSLDAPTPDQYGWRPRNGDERHRVVFSGIVDLPAGFQFSTLSTFGSGQAFRLTDGTNGATSGQNTFSGRYPNKNCIGGVFAFCEVNLTLKNTVHILGGDAEVAVDLLNAFNNKNFSGFDDFFNNQINPETGRVVDTLDPADIGRDLLTLPRRIQFRVGYRF